MKPRDKKMEFEELTTGELRTLLDQKNRELELNRSHSCAPEIEKEIEEIEVIMANRERKGLQVLEPIETSKQLLKKEYQRVKQVFKNFPRGGGGDFPINARETPEGFVVQFAIVKRDKTNNEGKPLPDGGLYDIAATKGAEDVVCHNKEYEICGHELEPDTIVAKAINERETGFVTRERKGKEDDYSVEALRKPKYTPGVWEEARDIQYERQIVLVEISPEGKVTCCDFGSRQNRQELRFEDCTEKVLLGYCIARDISKVLNE
ncbi:MAG: hypothetical protein KAQ64_01275 [Candidatus Pacebacteria bacterium]|nr:hypothetical protein [Candidatus Paceibacterota bacterium]